MDKFLIIDGNNIAFRAYYALPNLQNSKREKTSVLFGFSNILLKTIEDIQPKYIAVAFDKGKNTFRHRLYSDYKAKRNPTPQDLIDQLPKLKSLLKAMNIKVLEEDEIEADDIIGILSKSFDTENYLLSADKDILQLVSDKSTVISPKKGVTESTFYTPAKLKEEMDIEPYQIIELKALMGDASDNLPGVLGVGEKTALSLIQSYKTLDNVYQNLNEIKEKLRLKLEKDKESAYLSKELATIKTDFNLKAKLKDFELKFPFNKEVFEQYKKYELNSLLKRQDIFSFDVLEESKSYIPVNEDAKITKLKTLEEIRNLTTTLLEKSEFAIYISDSQIALSNNNNHQFEIDLSFDLLNPSLNIQEVMNTITPLFSSDRLIITLDAKELMHKLHKYGIELKSDFYDILIAKYLLISGIKYVGDYKSMIKEYNLNPDVPACNLYHLKSILEKEIEELNLQKVYSDIEIPLVSVLFKMELLGFKVDKKELINLEKRYEELTKKCTQEIYKLAGTEFNLNSTKQLSDILFNKLGLFDPTRNKKQSTNIEVLTEMIGQHPIIEKIIEYRQVSKLYSTYLSAFLDLIDKDNKIHTIFNQTLTSTGRLSSSEPNLQNIPVKSEEGKLIRKIFISSFENGKIVSADYSQIELRLLAAFSKDEELVKSYNNNEDVHKRTASNIFNVPYELVTEELRNKAKSVNFGIVYGMSDFGLSKSTGTTAKEAKEFIEQYYLKYPKIKDYMNSLVIYGKEHKFVKTYFGRIRNIPELDSPKKMVQHFGERAAMNMPLQGTASDIIKIAMVRVYKAIEESNLKSKLILTVHDELIVDTHPDEIEIIKNILRDKMENIVNLPVKLLVDIAVGDSWYNV